MNSPSLISPARLLVFVTAMLLPGAVCLARDAPASTFKLQGPAYHGAIPGRFTCDGKEVSPPLQWTGVPSGTRSLAFILTDPDAPSGLFVHWVLFNIPSDAPGLAAGANRDGLPGSTRVGTGTAGKAAYFAPCPPSGTHRYVHVVYALDTRLPKMDHPDRKTLMQAMQGHILAKARLVVPYKRQP